METGFWVRTARGVARRRVAGLLTGRRVRRTLLVCLALYVVHGLVPRIAHAAEDGARRGSPNPVPDRLAASDVRGGHP